MSMDPNVIQSSNRVDQDQVAPSLVDSSNHQDTTASSRLPQQKQLPRNNGTAPLAEVDKLNGLVVKTPDQIDSGHIPHKVEDSESIPLYGFSKHNPVKNNDLELGDLLKQIQMKTQTYLQEERKKYKIELEEHINAINMNEMNQRSRARIIEL